MFSECLGSLTYCVKYLGYKPILSDQHLMAVGDGDGDGDGVDDDKIAWTI